MLYTQKYDSNIILRNEVCHYRFVQSIMSTQQIYVFHAKLVEPIYVSMREKHVNMMYIYRYHIHISIRSEQSTYISTEIGGKV